MYYSNCHKKVRPVLQINFYSDIDARRSICLYIFTSNVCAMCCYYHIGNMSCIYVNVKELRYTEAEATLNSSFTTCRLNIVLFPIGID